MTGGGGGRLQPVAESGCSNFDAYAIGWSPTNSKGSRCGSARVPDSADPRLPLPQGLRLGLAGHRDAHRRARAHLRRPDVLLQPASPTPTSTARPPAGTSSTSATFSFHASSTTATFKCSLDGATPTVCTSPVTYSGLAQGSHTFTVDATVGGVADPLPASATWTVDTSPPTAPTGLAAVATSPFSVALSWTAASDNLAVTGYDVFRDGTLLATVPATTTYVDSSVLGSSTHQYAVRARDVGGNVSELTPAMQVTTPPPPSPVFSDGFESGDLGAWTTASGLTVESADGEQRLVRGRGEHDQRGDVRQEVPSVDLYGRLRAVSRTTSSPAPVRSTSCGSGTPAGTRSAISTSPRAVSSASTTTRRAPTRSATPSRARLARARAPHVDRRRPPARSRSGSTTP